MLSNLVNSGFAHIKVLTQYRATSLIRHLSRAWSLGGVLDASIDPVPAGQNIGPFWFRGTADAIWQNLDLLRELRPRDVVIFGSDHVYKMDVSLMLDAHRRRDADLTVATLPVPRSEARAFGCVKVDESGWVIDFLEKPDDPPGMPGNPDLTLVSMGNYAFRTAALLDELRRNAGAEATTHDFGRDVLTSAHKRMRVLVVRLRLAALSRRERELARLLARRRHDRRVLRGEPRPGLGRAAAQPVQRSLAAARQPAAVGPREVRLRRRGRGTRRPRGRLDRRRGHDRLGRADGAHRLLLPRALEQLQPGLRQHPVSRWSTSAAARSCAAASSTRACASRRAR